MFDYIKPPSLPKGPQDSFPPTSYKSTPDRAALFQASPTRTYASGNSQRKLGDFSSLKFDNTPNNSRGSPPFATACTRSDPERAVNKQDQHHHQQLPPSSLGDFTKVFAQLGRPSSSQSTPAAEKNLLEAQISTQHEDILPELEVTLREHKHTLPELGATSREPKGKNMALEALRPVDPFHKEDIISLVQQFIMDDSSETSYQPISEYKLSQKPYDAYVGGRTETTATKDSTDSESGSEASATYSTPKTSLAPSSPRRRSSSDKDAFLLSYQLHANGPILSISEKDRRRAYLPTNISQLYGKVLQTDSLVHAKCQDFKTNGIHIFLDMSNVYISFLNTIKERLQLPPGARFPKNPHLNLRRLTKLITRSRLVATRVAGCSVIPDRSEPVFVEHLRNYDYRVDVRERKAVQSSNQTGASPPKRSYSPKGVRYVEDLVDETLQTRIGETFMKSGHKKATLILVTGDAKPAPYADGFGECAKRALGWGWNVEVVNWSTSCSSIWRDMARDESYGNQFRLIDLDHYLKYLWTDEE